jgi:hypothetical protein
VYKETCSSYNIRDDHHLRDRMACHVVGIKAVSLPNCISILLQLSEIQAKEDEVDVVYTLQGMYKKELQDRNASILCSSTDF